MKVILIFIFNIISFSIYSQGNDTVYIIFNDSHEEMRKVDFTRLMQAGSPKEDLKKSIDYIIEQKEVTYPYDDKFRFTHFNQSNKAYKKFGGNPPVILKKPRSFLEDKNVLDIQFFRTTAYGEVTKTFEEEDSWKQDVMIFMVDVDEIENDSIVLREVDFSRPVKQ